MERTINASLNETGGGRWPDAKISRESRRKSTQLTKAGVRRKLVDDLKYPSIPPKEKRQRGRENKGDARKTVKKHACPLGSITSRRRNGSVLCSGRRNSILDITLTGNTASGGEGEEKGRQKWVKKWGERGKRTELNF